eukprot:1238050-Amphidinium_carterae.1
MENHTDSYRQTSDRTRAGLKLDERYMRLKGEQMIFRTRLQFTEAVYIYNDFKEDSELCFRLMRYIPKVYIENFCQRLTGGAELKEDEILKLFTIMKQDYVNEWLQNGTLPNPNIIQIIRDWNVR